jgi:hypothetical protein
MSEKWTAEKLVTELIEKGATHAPCCPDCRWEELCNHLPDDEKGLCGYMAEVCEELGIEAQP